MTPSTLALRPHTPDAWRSQAPDLRSYGNKRPSVALGKLPSREAPDHEPFPVPVSRIPLDAPEQVHPSRRGARAPHRDHVNGHTKLNRQLVGESRTGRMHVVAHVKHKVVTVAEQHDGTVSGIWHRAVCASHLPKPEVFACSVRRQVALDTGGVPTSGKASVSRAANQGRSRTTPAICWPATTQPTPDQCVSVRQYTGPSG